MIILDTSVISLALRRRKPDRNSSPVRLLYKFIDEEADLSVPGIVVQEVLSGVRTQQAFERLQSELEHFDVLLATWDDHLLAAQLVNQSLDQGFVLKTVDALIAAQTIAREARLFTLDQDFEQIATHAGLSLLRVEDE